MLSDEALGILIALHEQSNIQGGMQRDELEAFREVAQYRRTFAKIGEMLKAGAINFGLHGGDKFESVLFHYGVVVARQSADTPFAALSALADSIIREELERKDAK